MTAIRWQSRFCRAIARQSNGKQGFIERIASCARSTHVLSTNHADKFLVLHVQTHGVRGASCRRDLQKPSACLQVRTTLHKTSFSICPPSPFETKLKPRTSSPRKKNHPSADGSSNIVFGGMGGESEVKLCGVWMAFQMIRYVMPASKL